MIHILRFSLANHLIVRNCHIFPLSIRILASTTNIWYDGSSQTDNAGQYWRPMQTESSRKRPRTDRAAHECITCDDRLTTTKSGLLMFLRWFLVSANSTGRWLTAFPYDVSAKWNRYRTCLYLFNFSVDDQISRSRSAVLRSSSGLLKLHVSNLL